MTLGETAWLGPRRGAAPAVIDRGWAHARHDRATREQAGTKRNGWLDGSMPPQRVPERAADLEFHQVRHASLAGGEP